MPEIIHEMSSKRLGMTCVVDDDGRLAGVFTDGDLRRLFMAPAARRADARRRRRHDANPITVPRDVLAVEALRVMETHKITSVIVVDENRPSRESSTCTICGARR